jgi:hypothetical protein
MLHAEDKKLSEMTEFVPLEKKEKSQDNLNHQDLSAEPCREQTDPTPIYQVEVKTEVLQHNIVIAKQDPEDIEEKEPKVPVGFVTNYQKVKTMEVTPIGGMFVKRAVGAFVEGDYILWWSRQEGLAYAARGALEFMDNTFYTLAARGTYNLPQGKIYEPSFHASSGFKAGFGFNFDHDGWSFKALYTRLVSGANGKTPDTIPQAGMLVPLEEQLGFVVGVTNEKLGGLNQQPEAYLDTWEASTHWHLRFETLDLELAREYFIGSKLLLKTCLGLKGSLQKQIYNVYYSHGGTLTGFPVIGPATVVVIGQAHPVTVDAGKVEVLNIAFAGENTSIYNTQHYWSFGPRFGSNLSWLLSKNFSLFGDGAISALWGQFKDTRKDIVNIVQDFYTGAILVEDFPYVNTHQNVHDVNAVLEMQIGARYDWWSHLGSVRFRAQVGWENQIWFGQNHFNNILNSNCNQSNNLVLQGLTVKAQVDF